MSMNNGVNNNSNFDIQNFYERYKAGEEPVVNQVNSLYKTITGEEFDTVELSISSTLTDEEAEQQVQGFFESFVGWFKDTFGIELTLFGGQDEAVEENSPVNTNEPVVEETETEEPEERRSTTPLTVTTYDVSSLDTDIQTELMNEPMYVLFMGNNKNSETLKPETLKVVLPELKNELQRNTISDIDGFCDKFEGKLSDNEMLSLKDTLKGIASSYGNNELSSSDFASFTLAFDIVKQSKAEQNSETLGQIVNLLSKTIINNSKNSIDKLTASIVDIIGEKADKQYISQLLKQVQGLNEAGTDKNIARRDMWQFGLNALDKSIEFYNNIKEPVADVPEIQEVREDLTDGSYTLSQYDKDGRLLEKSFYDETGNFSLKYEVAYNDENFEGFPSGETWYDNQLRITSKVEYSYNKETAKPSEIISTYYDKEGNISDKYVSKINSNTGELVTNEQFNSNDELIEKRDFSYQIINGKKGRVEETTDSTGLLKSRKIRDAETGINISYEYYMYNDDGDKISSFSFSFDESTLTDGYSISIAHDYNSDIPNEVSVSEGVTFNPPQIAKPGFVLTLTDSAGNMITEYHYDENGELKTSEPEITFEEPIAGVPKPAPEPEQEPLTMPDYPVQEVTQQEPEEETVHVLEGTSGGYVRFAAMGVGFDSVMAYEHDVRKISDYQSVSLEDAPAKAQPYSRYDIKDENGNDLGYVEYDSQGRIYYTNNNNGEESIYVYDSNGTTVTQRNWSNKVLQQRIVYECDTDGVTQSYQVFDKDNKVIQIGIRDNDNLYLQNIEYDEENRIIRVATYDQDSMLAGVDNYTYTDDEIQITTLDADDNVLGSTTTTLDGKLKSETIFGGENDDYYLVRTEYDTNRILPKTRSYYNQTDDGFTYPSRMIEFEYTIQSNYDELTDTQIAEAAIIVQHVYSFDKNGNLEYDESESIVKRVPIQEFSAEGYTI